MGKNGAGRLFPSRTSQLIPGFRILQELGKANIRKMRNLAHMQVKGRVAQALLQLREQFGVTAEGYLGLTLSRQDLASLVGATYETVFRMINELAQERLILVDGKQLAIADADGLIRYTLETES